MIDMFVAVLGMCYCLRQGMLVAMFAVGYCLRLESSTERTTGGGEHNNKNRHREAFRGGYVRVDV